MLRTKSVTEVPITQYHAAKGCTRGAYGSAFLSIPCAFKPFENRRYVKPIPNQVIRPVVAEKLESQEKTMPELVPSVMYERSAKQEQMLTAT